MIIFPAIDLKDGKCVRLRQGSFDEVTTYDDNPVRAAERWRDEGARWLHLVDLDGARHGEAHTDNLAAITKIVQATGLPIQVGGGVRSADAANRLLDLGVTRIIAGTAVARDAALAESLFTHFGERIAVGVDARDGYVAVQGWVEHIGETATAFVERMFRLGASRFIFTDISRDGMLTGVNIASLARVAAVVPAAHVIASGGVTTVEDIDALLHLRDTGTANIEGAIVGKALYVGTVTLPDLLERASAATTPENRP
jgi:phosphoribosylformimino-5-aminoimidazole carboxamide ribotide isomerase